MIIPIYNAVIDDESGMTCLSLVTDPAVEQDFVCFEKHDLIKFDKDRNYITGVVMLADTPIYRRSQTMGEYYLVFDKKTIKTMVEKYLSEGLFNNISCQHDGNLIDGLSLVEVYFVDENKKSQFDVPEGSVVMTFRCSNDEVWDRIDAGELKGFSLEALIGLEPKLNMKKDNLYEDDYETWIDNIIS